MRLLSALPALILLSCSDAGPQVTEAEKGVLAYRFKECQLLIDRPAEDMTESVRALITANRVSPVPIQSVNVDMKEHWSVISSDPRTIRLSFEAGGTRFDCDAVQVNAMWEWVNVSRNDELVFTRSAI